MNAKKRSRANGRNSVHDQSGFVRDAVKRWERWPLVEEGDRGLAQSYLKGRLEIAVELKVTPDADHTAVVIIRANKVVNKWIHQ